MSSFEPSYARVFTPPEVQEKYEMPADGTLAFQSTVFLQEDTVGWLPEFFGRMSILKLIQAAVQSETYGGESCVHMAPAKGRPRLGSVYPRSSPHRLLEIPSCGSPARSGPGQWGRVASLLHKPNRSLAKNRTSY